MDLHCTKRIVGLLEMWGRSWLSESGGGYVLDSIQTVLDMETNFLCICLSHHSYTSYLFIDSEDSLSDADNNHDIKQTERQSQMALLQRQIEKKQKPLRNHQAG